MTYGEEMAQGCEIADYNRKGSNVLLLMLQNILDVS
jgi:hypothetical protein